MEKRSSYRARQPRRAITHTEQWYSGTEFAQYFQGLSKQTPEDRERKAAVRWWDATHPNDVLCLQGSLGDMWTSSFKQKSRNTAIGYRRGTHDLFLAIPSGAYHGLFFEMKGSLKDGLTPEQETFAAAMRERGYQTAFGMMRDFVRVVSAYLHNEQAFRIFGSEVTFERCVSRNQLIAVCQEIWDHPSRFAPVSDGTSEAWYSFLTFLWILTPTNKEFRLADVINNPEIQAECLASC